MFAYSVLLTRTLASHASWGITPKKV
jgi:hypothetical protein